MKSNNNTKRKRSKNNTDDSILQIIKNKLNEFLIKFPQFPFQFGNGLFFSVIFASVASFIFTPAIGIPLGIALGMSFGMFWGNRKWNQHMSSSSAVKDESKTTDYSIIDNIPVLGHLYRLIKNISKYISNLLKKYNHNVLVADLSAGVGVAVGYEIGFMAGSIIAPGIGSLVGALIGSVVGFVGGLVLGAHGSQLLHKKFGISFDKQRIATAGGIAGAGIGAATGALIGTFIFPGLGTLVGSAVGATIGAVLGGVCACTSSRVGNKLDKFSEFFSMGPGISSGSIIGSIIGTIIAPGLGTAIGAVMGAVSGAGLAWVATKYGNYLRERNNNLSSDLESHNWNKEEIQKNNPRQAKPNSFSIAMHRMDSTQYNTPEQPKRNRVAIGMHRAGNPESESAKNDNKIFHSPTAALRAKASISKESPDAHHSPEPSSPRI